MESLLLRPWWARPEVRDRWAQEVASMAVAYPSFRVIDRHQYRTPGRIVAAVAAGAQYEKVLATYPEDDRERVEREQCGELVRAWQGMISPLASNVGLDEIQRIVADLDEDRPVRVLVDGILAHYEGCGGRHRVRPEFRLARRPQGTFEIEVAYRIPPGHPIVRSLRPTITRDAFPDGPPPHLLNNIGALCILFPADGVWVWPRDGVREYANYTAIWLAKHLTWIEARERGVGVEAAWPGSSVGHETEEVNELIRPGDGCRCGSERPYGACCRPRDQASLAERRSYSTRADSIR